jgi:hypothetical protein
VGLFLIHLFEKRANDKRVLYSVILIVTILSYFLPAGIVI